MLKIAKPTREFKYTTKFIWETVTATSRTSLLRVSQPLSKRAPNSKTVRKNSHMKMKRGKRIARSNLLIRTKRLFNKRCARITTQGRTLF
jgi:hypothetical protein